MKQLNITRVLHEILSNSIERSILRLIKESFLALMILDSIRLLNGLQIKSKRQIFNNFILKKLFRNILILQILSLIHTKNR